MFIFLHLIKIPLTFTISFYEAAAAQTGPQQQRRHQRRFPTSQWSLLFATTYLLIVFLLYIWLLTEFSKVSMKEKDAVHYKAAIENDRQEII